MLIGERVVHLRGSDRWPSLRAERRPMAHAVAGGLVLELVLAEGVWRNQRGRLVVTGHPPSDAILADTIEGLADRRRPPRVAGFVRDLAVSEGGGVTVEAPLVTLVRSWIGGGGRAGRVIASFEGVAARGAAHRR